MLVIAGGEEFEVDFESERVTLDRMRRVLERETGIPKHAQLLVYDGRAIDPKNEHLMDPYSCVIPADTNKHAFLFEAKPIDTLEEDEDGDFKCSCCQLYFKMVRSVQDLTRRGYSTAVRSRFATLCSRCQHASLLPPYNQHAFHVARYPSKHMPHAEDVMDSSSTSQESGMLTPPQTARVTRSKTRRLAMEYGDVPGSLLLMQTPVNPCWEPKIPNAPRKKRRNSACREDVEGSPTPAPRNHRHRLRQITPNNYEIEDANTWIASEFPDLC